MKREEIEKAAEDFVMQNSPSYTECFLEGADWRINSVWHNMDEKPNFKILPILLKHKSGTIHFINETPAHWGYMMKYYVSWAYVNDLIPNKEE